MTADIDQLNYYDPILANKPDKMSEVWIGNFASLIQDLQGYLSSFGIFVPQVTNAQRATIQSPINGQMIYNSDSNEFQGWKVNTWVTIA